MVHNYPKSGLGLTFIAMQEKLKIIKAFYAGIIRDEKSKITGAASNIEEVDIFSNADYIQAEQIFSADALPATTEAYAYTSDSAGTAFAYGSETAASKVRILSVSTGGADNPGAWSTLSTSADTTNLAYAVSPIQYFKTTEAAPNWLYYCTKTAGNVVKLFRQKTDGTGEAEVGTLSGLTGSYDRISMKVIAGTLHITNGAKIATVDQDAVYTDNAFNLPLDYTAVDIVPVGTVSIILARHIDRTSNHCKVFWWDLVPVSESEYDGYDDSFEISTGGPQWATNYREKVIIFCSINGKGQFFVLNGAYQGSVPQALPGILLTSVASDTATQPISAPKMVAVKEKILYFGLNKTDKSGVYALGQLDDDKPLALILSKKFSTTTITNHKPTALFILGPNFYGAYVDNTTASTARCESNNTPNRSASAIYESVVIDDDSPQSNKDLSDVVVTTQPLPASTDVNVSVANDYGSYTEVFRPDGTSLNTTSAIQGDFKPKASKGKKSFKVKLELVSSTSSSPKVTSIGLRFITQAVPAPK